MAAHTWDIVRHQVAIAGRVTEALSGEALGGTLVRISAGPPEFQNQLTLMQKKWGTRWSKMLDRYDQRRTASDGHFHFMDLPNGAYILIASIPGMGSRYDTEQAYVSVTRDDEDRIEMSITDIELSPTMIQGHIEKSSGGDDDEIPMAEIRVTGSGERAFTNDDGNYRVIGVETGTRQLTASAPGYDRESATVTLSTPGSVQTMNFTLHPMTNGE